MKLVLRLITPRTVTNKILKPCLEAVRISCLLPVKNRLQRRGLLSV